LMSSVVLFALPILAQEHPRSEIYGGFNVMLEPDMTIPGFRAEGAVNLNQVVGLVGEVSFGTTSRGEEGIRDTTKEYFFLAGPRFSYRTKQFRVFASVLAGVGHESIHRDSLNGISETYWSKAGPAMSAGIGFDVRINDWISARPAQADWLAAKFNDIGNSRDTAWAHRFRYSAGIVFKLGHIGR